MHICIFAHLNIKNMLLLSTAYLAPVQYYAHIYAAKHIIEDQGEHYIKQTYRNRCYIATPTGAQALTLPIVRSGAAHAAVHDIQLSDHGNWQHLHWTALVSAYESSPYFEYYADDFRPLYEKKFKYLVDFNSALETTLLQLLALEKDIEVHNEYITATPEMLDLRNAISPKAPAQADPHFVPQPYYQVFSQRTGFLPNLSMVDLLFNMGPESRLVLKQCLKADDGH